MSTHAPHTRPVPLWQAPLSKHRTPVPSDEAVAAAPLLAGLWQALGDEPSPCASAPDVWTSEHRDDVAVAQEGCAECPAQRQCLVYAIASDATAGVWGGRDMARRPGRRRPTADDITEMERTA